jgi:hypothetical protein
MADDERKSRLHIHTGGLIILIIIILILFKIDIKSKIQSPQFQKNITYIETAVKTFWQNNIVSPFKDKTSGWLKSLANKKFDQIQENVNNNIFKIPSAEDIENASN